MVTRLPFPLFRSGHMSAICARLSKGKVGVQRGRKTAGCPSFLPPPRVRRVSPLAKRIPNQTHSDFLISSLLTQVTRYRVLNSVHLFFCKQFIVVKVIFGILHISYIKLIFCSILTNCDLWITFISL